MMRTWLARYSRILARIPTLGLLRLTSGCMFAEHGAAKLFGLLGGFGGPRHTAPFLSEPWFAGICEFFGGLLIAMGLWTRPVAFVLAGEMAVAYFQVHFPQGFWPMRNDGELAALYCFVFLTLAGRGDGGLSLDATIAKRPCNQVPRRDP
jgi:putative oxidoreductase